MDPLIDEKNIMGLTNQQITMGITITMVIVIIYYVNKNKPKIMKYIRGKKKKKAPAEPGSDDEDGGDATTESIGSENDELADHINSLKS